MNDKKQLLHHLINNTRVLQSSQLKIAFDKIDRKDFVDTDYKEEAYEDYPLPIGFGQTISQPTTVLFMLRLLDPKPDNNVLDVGSGSGYSTALIATLVPQGNVLGLEIIPELVEIGRKNIARYNFTNAKIELADSRPESFINFQNFDRILVNAAAKEIPEHLIEILRPEGIMVIPVERSLFKVYKNKNNEIEVMEYPGFSFVDMK